MKQVLFICSFLFITAFLTTCTKNQVDPGPVQVITIRGEVELNAFGQGIKGEDLTLQAAKITSAGELISVPDVSASVDSEGNYEINFDEREALMEAVIVSHDGQRFVGYLSANVENGTLYYLEPIGSKSTLNTNIYRGILKETGSNSVRKSDITNVLRLVDSEMIIHEEALTQSLAVGILQYLNARTAYSGSSGSNVGNFDLLLAHELMDQAQLSLQRDLVLSNSDVDIASAYRFFYDRILESVKNIYDNRVNAARMTNIQRNLLAKSLKEILNAELTDQVNQSTAYFASLALIDSIEETLKQSRISDTVQDQISQSGDQLLDLLYKPEGSVQEIAVMMNQFSDEVLSNFKSDQMVDSDAIDSIINTINASGGPGAEFNTEIESGTSALPMIDAHDKFFRQIRDIVSESRSYGEVNRNVLTNIIYLTQIY